MVQTTEIYQSDNKAVLTSY